MDILDIHNRTKTLLNLVTYFMIFSLLLIIILVISFLVRVYNQGNTVRIFPKLVKYHKDYFDRRYSIIENIPLRDRILLEIQKKFGEDNYNIMIKNIQYFHPSKIPENQLIMTAPEYLLESIYERIEIPYTKPKEASAYYDMEFEKLAYPVKQLYKPIDNVLVFNPMVTTTTPTS